MSKVKAFVKRERNGRVAKPSMHDVARGMTVYWRAFRGNIPYVDTVTARNRASICAKCPLNVGGASCTTCSNLYQQMVRAIGQTRVNDVQRHVHPRKLQVCAACKCLNAAKVWLDKGTLAKTTTERHLETFATENPGCWVLKELQTDPDNE